MSTLHIYHNMHLKSKINTFNKNDVIILHNRITINLLKHLFRMNRTDMNELNLTFITIEELLQGKIDNMRFDYIVGNPPYQYGGENSTQKKLYIDITKKVINLLNYNGIISFITPTNILLPNTKKKDLDDFLSNNLIEVSHDANKHFDIGQTVISFTCLNNNNNKKILLKENQEEHYVESIYDCFSKNLRTFISIMRKVSIKFTHKPKLKISQNNNKKAGISPQDTLEFGKYKIISSNKNEKYTNTDNSFMRLLIPYSGKLEASKIGCLMSDYGWYSTKKNKWTVKQLHSMKAYIDSKLIQYLLWNFSNKLVSKQTFDFLRELPEIDFSREWTDDELYKEFNLTDDEINEVENWYKEWII